MNLKWMYTAVDEVLVIVWNYTEFGPDKVPITIARRNLSNGVVDVSETTKFYNRLQIFNDSTSNAGIQLNSVLESDEGIFDVSVSLKNQSDLTDNVSVSFKAYMRSRKISLNIISND